MTQAFHAACAPVALIVALLPHVGAFTASSWQTLSDKATLGVAESSARSPSSDWSWSKRPARLELLELSSDSGGGKPLGHEVLVEFRGRGPRHQAEAALAQTPKLHMHRVEHAAILNRDGLWWLMGAIIIAIGLIVIRFDHPSHSSAGSDKTAEDGSEQQGNSTKYYYLHLAFCVIGLNVTMLFWGIDQEYMMTTTYRNREGDLEQLPSALFLVLCNRSMSILFSAFLIFLHNRTYRFPGVYDCSLPAVSNLIASWCQYQSLSYVSFPVQTATKSAKLLPVLLLSSLRGKRHSLLDYAEAVVIVSALVVFGLETSGNDGGVEVRGAALLAGFTLADSITPHLQDALFKKHTSLLVVQATFAMSIVASIIIMIVLLADGQLFTSISFFHRHPQATLHAAVLSLCSTLTQFLNIYTIKHFGPVVFIIIATTRQLISVCISAVLFQHRINAVAWIAACLVFGTVVCRALRPRDAEETKPKPIATDNSKAENTIDCSKEEQEVKDNNAPATPRGNGPPNVSYPAAQSPNSMSEQHHYLRIVRESKMSFLMVCFIGILIPLAVYSMVQEFMSIHTFYGHIFHFPMFLVAANRTGAAVFGFFILKIQGIRVFEGRTLYTALPACTNLIATFCQYEALFFLRYPEQTFMKSVKMIPVMLMGRLLKNRIYGWVDYFEGVVVTVLVSMFMWSFHNDNMPLREDAAILPGILLMLGYIISDSFMSNTEDYIYQKSQMDPGQMMFGVQLVSGFVGWAFLLFSGQLIPAIHFILEKGALLNVLILVLAESAGAYACSVTVRNFGPAVFTLLMMSHQMVSAVVSVALFHHSVSMLNRIYLAVVALVLLIASVRRVNLSSSTWQHEKDVPAIPGALKHA